MNKNKSESITSKTNQTRMSASFSSKQKGKKNELRNFQKPTIDIEIAKGLDTLDRQGIRNLKNSLKASQEWNKLQERKYGQENYVQQQIVCEDDDFEDLSPTKFKHKNNIVDEIKQQIIEYPDEESPNKDKNNNSVQQSKKVVYYQGKVKTYIKPRPISAVQKQQITQNRNSQIIKNSYDNSSLSFRQQKNPFKKSQSTVEKKQKQSQKITSLLKRIKNLETSQREQLQIILQKIQKGQIESVENSNEIIKMVSPQKSNFNSVQNQQSQRLSMQKRSSIPTISLEPSDRLHQYIETQSKIIESQIKSKTLGNNMTLPDSKQTKAKIKDNIVLPVSSFKQSNIKQVKIVTKKQNIFVMKILSNWGHQRMIGLTKIELFSKDGQMVTVQQNQIKNCSKRMLKLFSGSPFTTNENQMWINPCPEAPAVIVIQIALNTPLGAVRIWNYNKSQIQSTKGTKSVKLIMNDEKWNGQIKKGCGNQFEDYSTLIKFSMNPNIIIPEVEIPKHYVPPQSMSIPLITKESQKKNWLQQTLMKKQLAELTQGNKVQSQQKLVNEEKQINNENNKVKRSGSYQIRKSGTKSSISNRGQKITQKIQPSIVQLSEHKKFLEIQAQAVKKGVAQSLQKVKMNLQFEPDIFTKNIENIKSKSIKGQKKSTNTTIPITIIQKQQLKKRAQSSKQRKPKLQSIPDVIKNNYAMNIPPLNKLEKLPKHSPIINKQKSLDNVLKLEQDKMLQIQRNQKQIQKPLQNLNNLQIKQVDDVIKIVKPAMIKNVSSILNEKQQDDLGKLMKQLNSILPSHSPINIPELPKGTRLNLTLLSNHGDPYYVGLSKIQVFDKYGNLCDIGFGQISGNCEQHPISNLINQNIKVYDKNGSWLTELRKSNKISIDLQMQTSISLIRVWNYNESRIHSNRGVKILSIQLDNVVIFEGQISKFSGQYNFQDCQYLLFTQSQKVLNSIIQNDWISKMKNQISDYQLKNTITNFVRPQTSQKQQSKSKENRQINIPSNAKKYKSTYQTPILPKGKCLEILLLTTWGDRHYVGLNKLEVFNSSKTNLLSKKGAYKISAIPSSVASLPNMSNDPRTIDKLVSNDSKSMWLSPMNSDIQKIQNNINSITIKFNSNQTIGMINLWNYSKTSSRGVRQIMVILDDVVIYQGYIANSEYKEYTSISFCKDIGYLQQMKYQGYNQDHQQQQVGLVNEKKQVKSMPVQIYSQMQRPFTSAIGK